MARPAADHGPAGHRATPWSVLAVAPYREPDRGPTDARLDGFDRAVSRDATGASFLTLLTDVDRTASAFTAANLARLREVKRRYDPELFFRPPHTIGPASPGPHLPGELP